MRKDSRGFSLIELLIVVAIILIIAAIAIPNLLRSRIAANQASAVGSLRTINTCEITYASTYNTGYSADLPSLGPPAGGGQATSTAAGLLDSVLAAGLKSGYTFTYTPGEKVNGAIRSYTVTAVPDQVGTTGQRRFFSDESGEIHYNASGPADATSAVIQ